MGVDYSGSRPSAAALKSAGVQFVCRYLAPQGSANNWKLLTWNEAQGLLAGGEHIVSNFESTGTDFTGGFNQGVYDAKIGDAWHKACGGPADAPIYFSIDEQTSGASTKAYFQGIASVIGLARTGAYGSYAVCKYLIDNNLVGKCRDGSAHWYAWQTYAWSFNAYDERCALSQDSNNRTVAGASVDIDHAHTTDYGQWGFSGGEDDGLANITQADFNALMHGFLTSSQGKTDVATGVWHTDNVIGAPASVLAVAPDNKAWLGASFLDEIYDHVAALSTQVAQIAKSGTEPSAPAVNIDEATLTKALTAALVTALAGQSFDVTPKAA